MSTLEKHLKEFKDKYIDMEYELKCYEQAIINLGIQEQVLKEVVKLKKAR